MIRIAGAEGGGEGLLCLFHWEILRNSKRNSSEKMKIIFFGRNKKLIFYILKACSSFEICNSLKNNKSKFCVQMSTDVFMTRHSQAFCVCCGRDGRRIGFSLPLFPLSLLFSLPHSLSLFLNSFLSLHCLSLSHSFFAYLTLSLHLSLPMKTSLSLLWRRRKTRMRVCSMTWRSSSKPSRLCVCVWRMCAH